MSKLTKAEAKKLRFLINKVVAIEVYITQQAHDQIGSNPLPEHKRRTRALRAWIDKRTEK